MFDEHRRLAEERSLADGNSGIARALGDHVSFPANDNDRPIPFLAGRDERLAGLEHDPLSDPDDPSEPVRIETAKDLEI